MLLDRPRADAEGRRGREGRGARPAAPLADPHDIETALRAREALRAVAGLRWRQRRVIALRLAGYSYVEIAQRLGVTYTNVNRHISAGLAELRRLRDAA